MQATQALGLLPQNQKARAMAEKALSDERGEVRAAAAEALGLIGDKKSAPKLVNACKDKEASVVFSAANALYVLGDPAAFQVFYAVLTGEKKSGEGLVESQMKMLKDPAALSKLGFEAGIGFIPFGGISYKVFKMATKDDVSPVRAAAAVKLVTDPDPKSAQALAASCKDDKWLVRAAAAGAISRRGNASLLSAIIPLLNDSNDVVRFTSAAGVVRLSTNGKTSGK
jgi:HEAT repeat protein